jgi:hypothetical protein
MKGAYGMSLRTTLAALAILGLSVTGCDYIVPPPEIGSPTPVIVSQGWAGEGDGRLRQLGFVARGSGDREQHRRLERHGRCREYGNGDGLGG